MGLPQCDLIRDKFMAQMKNDEILKKIKKN